MLLPVNASPSTPLPRVRGQGETTHRVCRTRRRGMVLIIVLVVIMLLSLGAYTFSEYMVIATKSAAINGKAIQARALADSGVEFASVILGNRANLQQIGLYHNPSLFQGHLILNSSQPRGQGRFTIVAPVEGDRSFQQVRFGLIDESSKLNLNTITAKTPPARTTTTSTTTGSTGTEETEKLANPLMGIPGMTLEISEAIFDWIDDDDDARENGAESEYYQQLSPPYECKNAKLETMDELLLIRGITPQLLFGEDANRNGLLDPNENDGELTAPLDNADGVLDLGWSAYLTVYSRELNLQPDRTSRIDVNSNTLSDVYDKLEDMLDDKKAQFIIAYRLNGAMPDPTSTTGTGGSSGGSSGSGGGASRSSGGGSGGGGGATVGGATISRGATVGGATVSNGSNSAGAIAQAMGQALAGRSGQVTRGGMDLTNGGKVKINSVYDLVGVQVRAQINGTSTVLDSPWSADNSAMTTYLPELLDTISTQGAETYIEGRININHAHKEVLLGLPDMTEELVEKIVGAQHRGGGGEPLPDEDNKRSNTSWLFTEGIMDLPTLRTLDPYLTGRGDVFRIQVMGHFDGGGPVARVEAVIDATQNPPQPLFFRDLTDLGRGYSLPVMNR